MFKYKKLTIGLVLGLLILPYFSRAVSLEQTFNIDANYDISGRNKINAQLIRTTNQLDFYADKEWWTNIGNKDQINALIYNLSTEFEYKIYPTLTNLYGKLDDNHFIIVFHKMKTGYGGYTQIADFYSKNLYPQSNETPVIFLNIDALNLPFNNLTYYLSHEFTHLLSIELKNKRYHIQDDTWLEELRAEYSETLLGYDKDFNNSILKNRVRNFLIYNTFSFKDWQNSDKDYADVNLLGHYLVEQYGINILKDTLNTSFTGSEALDYALKKNGYNIDFEDVVRDWMIASVVNDCSISTKYCYQNSNLKNVKVNGEAYYLPTKFKSSLGGTDFLKNFSGKWLKIVGGLNTINIKFNIPSETPIEQIPYVIIKTNGQKQVGFFDFSSINISEIYVSKMNDEVEAIYLMPYLFNKTLDDNKLYYYTFEVNSLENNSQTEQQIILKLTQQILELKRQLTQLQMQIALKNTYQTNPTCSVFKRDLSYGMQSEEVKCLQQFLANLDSDIYPEKLITGYYGTLTLNAVKRYQAKYNLPQTGYFGPLTRARANQEL